MLIIPVVSTNADTAFVNVLNNQASALAAGKVVVWNTSTPDGVRTTQAASGTLSLFVGIADSAIPASGYGVAQAYGYRSAALVTNTTNQAITAGDILIPVAAADHLARSGAGDGKTGFVFAAADVATATTPAAASVAVFIRAL